MKTASGLEYVETLKLAPAHKPKPATPCACITQANSPMAKFLTAPSAAANRSNFRLAKAVSSAVGTKASP